MNPTGIEWCDATWNPVRGCSRVSEGCRHCYAERMAARFSGPVHGLKMAGTGHGAVLEGRAPPFARFASMVGGEPRWTGRVELVPARLADPLRVRRGRRVFVNSMSDLFHERLPFEDIARVHAVMAMARRHRFLVLTKRPQRAVEFYAWLRGEMARSYAPAPAPDGLDFNALVGPNWERLEGWPSIIHAAGRLAGTRDGDFPPTLPLPNVAIGVSVEDQATADERIPELLATPAAMRFVSYEPALGPVDFTHIDNGWVELNALRSGAKEDATLDWIIVGGESGPGARPFDPLWLGFVGRQCEKAGVAVFFKQFGSVLARQLGLKDRAGADAAEWTDNFRRSRQLPKGWE